MIPAEKVIITCAITGAVHMPCMSPHLPITPDEIATEAIAAAEAGAAMVHLHARDPETGMPTTDPEIYRQFLTKIKDGCDAIVNITTGQPSIRAALANNPEFAFEDRMAAPLEFAPEVVSFNMGPMNPALFALEDRFKDNIKHEWESMFFHNSKKRTILNTYEHMEYIGRELGEKRDVRFEFECFDVGHLYTLKFIKDLGWIKGPLFVQSIYGFLGGLQPDPMHVLHMHQTAEKLFGNDYSWSNLAAGKAQMKTITMGAIIGGHVRVGMEDSLWYNKNEMAVSNVQQVARIKRILEELNIEVATPDEARKILGTKGGANVNF